MICREIDRYRMNSLAKGENALQPLLRETDLDAQRILSFVHIPKTAGTTLYNYLDTKFLPQQVFPADRADWHANAMHGMCPRSLDEFRCLRGHLYTQQLGRFFKATQKTIVSFTVLRHPEAQMLSEYHMICHDPNAAEYRPGPATEFTFDRFLEHPRFPSLAIERPDLAHCMCRNRQTAHLLMQTEHNPYVIPERDWFGLVTEHLEEYLLVGVNERLEQTVQLLAFLLGWHGQPALPVLNKGRGKGLKLNERQLQRLKELNAVDFQLYDWALARFQRQYAAMLERLEVSGAVVSDLATALNQRGDERIRNRAQAGALAADDYEVINTTGLLLGHVSRDFGRQINWIGPEPKATMRLAFPVSTRKKMGVGSRVLRIELLYWLTQSMLDDFYVKVNGRPVALVRHQEAAACQFVGFLPEELLGPPGTFVEVEMGTSSVSNPAELGLNPRDQEQKCLALASFQCFPATVPALVLNCGSPLGNVVAEKPHQLLGSTHT